MGGIEPRPERARHAWVKLRVHVYVCARCGCGKVNAQRGGRWVATFHRPGGDSIESARVPACETGPRTAAHLAKYAAEISAALRTRGKRKGAAA